MSPSRHTSLLVALVGCATAAPVRTEPAIAHGRAELSELAAIGETEDSDGAAEHARAFVRRSAGRAARAAADAILRGVDDAPARGARLVLMSLERAEDFAFLRELPPAPPHHAALSCHVIDLIYLVRTSVEIMGSDSSSTQAGRLPYVPAYGEMLVRVADQPWATCVRTCETCETSRRLPSEIADEILAEMAITDRQRDAAH